MGTRKNNEKEPATAQAAPTPEKQETQAAPAEENAAAPAPEKVDKKADAAKAEKKPADSVLQKAGKAAIARHGFKEVFVTSDGQAFPLQSDARHHAADLANKEIIKVTK